MISDFNAGPSDSRPHGASFNDSSGCSTRHSLDHGNSISRNDKLCGPLPPMGQLPNFDSQTLAGIELGTNLNAPLGWLISTPQPQPASLPA